MKNISTGTGLCVLGLCLASYPIIDRVMPRAEAGATHVAAVVAAATAQNPPEPTIVWYGTSGSCSVQTPYGTYEFINTISRAWSDGRVEQKYLRKINYGYPSTDLLCSTAVSCSTAWLVVSDPSQGFNASADINFDSKVDGADLSQVLNDWGNAPRQDIPPSICPLNLINP